MHAISVSAHLVMEYTATNRHKKMIFWQAELIFSSVKYLNYEEFSRKLPSLSARAMSAGISNGWKQCFLLLTQSWFVSIQAPMPWLKTWGNWCQVVSTSIKPTCLPTTPPNERDINIICNIGIPVLPNMFMLNMIGITRSHDVSRLRDIQLLCP